MKVKATMLGYYNNKRMREGTVFNLSSEKHFSKSWMTKVEAKGKGHKQKAAKEDAPVREVVSDQEVI